MRHPLHPMLVHFPIACWSLATAADFATLVFDMPLWQWSAGLIALGCLVSLPAMIAGFYEFSRIAEGPALRDGYWHMGLMSVAFLLFVTRLLLRIDHMQAIPPNAVSGVLTASGFIVLALGGWLGGRLVYGHGVGRH